MIRPHRRVHRRVMTVLAVALPLLLIAALRARRDVPAMPALPAFLAGDAAPGRAAWTGSLTLDGNTVALRLMEGVAGLVVELEPAMAPRRPGVLVYWAPSSAPAREARLLGALGGAWPRRFSLPPDAAPDPGVVRLLSALDGELLATAPLGDRTAP